MLNISNNGIIRLSRGDSFSCPVFVNMGTELVPIRYELQDDDKLYFALMEPNQPFEEAILKKVLTKDDLNENGDAVLTLVPSDTENLVVGLYYYTIKLRRPTEGEPQVDTVVPNRQFWIEGE
ncbi:MAG: hypothetical protein J6S67_19985 [Methanobrevibacter sp.]|nr:hypothetical protein [Methanobrevibacter sp.]